jgi:hypothetical protein
MWIERPVDAVQNSQTTKNAQEVLKAHTSVTSLEADKRVARDPGSVG